MVSLSFAPKDRVFFDLLTEAGQNAVRASGLLQEMLQNWPDGAEGLNREILKAEQEGDRITHDIIKRLNSTFVTPIDREDIHALATSLDDVMDAIDAAAGVLRRYRMASLRYGARELASLTWQAAMQMKVAVEALDRRTGVHERAVEVNRLENSADDVHDEALRRLFEEERDARIYVLLDLSGSMSRGEKLGLAKKMAAAFAYVGMKQFDRATVMPFGDDLERETRPLRTPADLPEIDRFLELCGAGGPTSFLQAVRSLGERYPQRGLVVVVLVALNQMVTRRYALGSWAY